MVTESEIKNALGRGLDPDLGQDIVELEMVRDLRATDGKVAFTLTPANLSYPFKDGIVNNAEQDGTPFAGN